MPTKAMREAEARRKAAPAVPEPAAEPAAPVEVAKVEAEPDAAPRVYQPERRCDRCGSIRSRLLTTKPDPDGRVAYRQCKACLSRFWCYEMNAR